MPMPCRAAISDLSEGREQSWPLQQVVGDHLLTISLTQAKGREDEIWNGERYEIGSGKCRREGRQNDRKCGVDGDNEKE